LGPGNYTFTQVSALAQFGTPVAPNVAPQFLISVARNHSDFRPTAGPHQVFNITTVTIQISTLAVSGFGCFSVEFHRQQGPAEGRTARDLNHPVHGLRTTLGGR
jgi:hypothetical protein